MSLFPASPLRAHDHHLSFVVRYDDHFLARPVPDVLPVRIANTLERPVPSSSGSHRHPDGTYRFVDLPNGNHLVAWLAPLTRKTDAWFSAQPPLEVQTPRIDPTELIRRELWPTPAAPVPAGMTCVRGKLSGPNNSNRRVTIQPTAGTPSGHFTVSDDTGEFLFLVPKALPISSTKTVALTASVTGGIVAGGRILPDGATFVGANFRIPAGRPSRIVFALS